MAVRGHSRNASRGHSRNASYGPVRRSPNPGVARPATEMLDAESVPMHRPARDNGECQRTREVSGLRRQVAGAPLFTQLKVTALIRNFALVAVLAAIDDRSLISRRRHGPADPSRNPKKRRSPEHRACFQDAPRGVRRTVRHGRRWWPGWTCAGTCFVTGTSVAATGCIGAPASMPLGEASTPRAPSLWRARSSTSASTSTNRRSPRGSGRRRLFGTPSHGAATSVSRVSCSTRGLRLSTACGRPPSGRIST